MEDTHFSIYVYEESGDINADDLYLISNIEEDDEKLFSQILMLNLLGILSFRITDYLIDLFNQYVNPFDPSILRERRTFYELQLFKKHRGSIPKPFRVHPKYPFCYMFIVSYLLPKRTPIVILVRVPPNLHSQGVQVLCL